MRIQWFSGVRVLGLLFVLIYHFFKDILPGGFIGVDIFFTFSGYLITALLLDEFEKKHQIDVVAYARRRFYRIVPPLVFMILAALPFALLIRKDYLAMIWQQIVAALGFMTNFYEISLGSNYEAQFAPHLLLHTWSLGIEVHYYIFWGLLLWGISRVLRTRDDFRKIVSILSLELTVLSLAVMIGGILMKVPQSTLYFMSFSHSFPIFLGSFLATKVSIRKQGPFYQRLLQKIPPVVTIALTALLTISLVTAARLLHFDSDATYLYGFAIASLLSTGLILLGRLLNDQFPNRKEPAWLTYIANVSYGVYLFHWPFYHIFKELFNPLLASVLTALVSFALTTISFYVIEPLLLGREVKLGRWLASKKLVFGLLVPLALVSLVFLGKVVTEVPHLGPFEQNMQVKSLEQAKVGMTNTKRLATMEKTSSGQSAPLADDLSNLLVIGDSVILDAHDIMPEKFQNAVVDVQVGRGFAAAYDIYKNQIDSGVLPDYVVISEGANVDDNYKADIKAFVDALPKDKHLIFITPYSQTDEPDIIKATRDYELSLAESNPQISVVDWYQIASDHPELWVGSDGTHFSHTGETDREGSELLISGLLDTLKPFQTGNAAYHSDNLLFIGDSVAVHAGDALKAALPDSLIDSLSNRNLRDAISIVDSYIAQNNLPKTLVLAVGVNEVTTFKEDLDSLIERLPKGTQLVLVTPHNGNYSDIKDSNVSRMRDYEKKLAKKYDFITVADWDKVAKEHPEIWEGTDLVHFERSDGVEDYDMLAKASGYYTDVITDAIGKVQAKAGKDE